MAVGRAIVREPQVFLFDEPLSNLDAKLRVQTRAEIIKLHKQLGATFIYVTHDQTEAMTMGTRIAVMKDGVLQQVDTPQTLYDRPGNHFVAGFIGSPSMNFFEMQLIRSGDELVRAERDAAAAHPARSAHGAQRLRRKIHRGGRAARRHLRLRISSRPASRPRRSKRKWM